MPFANESHEGNASWALYLAVAFIAFTSFIYDSFKGDDLSSAGVLLAVRDSAQPHEDAVLCKELAERRRRDSAGFSRLYELANRSIPNAFLARIHEFKHAQNAAWNIALFKLFLARTLDEVPSAIPKSQLQLSKLDIAAGDRKRRVPNATRRPLQHPDTVRTPRDSA